MQRAVRGERAAQAEQRQRERIQIVLYIYSWREGETLQRGRQAGAWTQGDFSETDALQGDAFTAFSRCAGKRSTKKYVKK